MTDKKLEGRGAIVTGGALGIGGGTARRLASEGAKVLIVDVVEDAAEANAKRIRDAGGTAIAMTGGLGSILSCQRQFLGIWSAFNNTLGF